MRIFEEAAFEAFLLTAQWRAHYAGKQPNASIEKGESAHFAAGKYVISDRYGKDRSRLEQPLVEPFEAAA